MADRLLSARAKFGNGGIGEVRSAADIKVGISGRRGAFAAFALYADIPTLLRGGAREALGGHEDFARVALTIRKYGVDISLKVN